MKSRSIRVAGLLIFGGLAFLIGCGVNVAAADGVAVAWQGDSDEAWRTARDSGRPLLLVFTSDTCYFCQKLMRDTLSHPQVAVDIQRSFVATSVHVGTRPQLVRKAGVHSLPTVFVIGPDGRIRDRIVGYQGPAQFHQRLKLAVAD